MDEMITKIEETVSKLLSYDQPAYAGSAEELANMMMSQLPTVISYYMDPRMSDHAEDATYWPGQLQRILDAFEKGDDFATADILFNETRANLIELKGILKSKGLI